MKRLDPLVRTGSDAVAALVEVRREARRAGSGLGGYALKRPIAILVRRNGATAAFDPAGVVIELNAFDRQYPGCRTEFERWAEDLCPEDGAGGGAKGM